MARKRGLLKRNQDPERASYTVPGRSFWLPRVRFSRQHVKPTNWLADQRSDDQRQQQRKQQQQQQQQHGTDQRARDDASSGDLLLYHRVRDRFTQIAKWLVVMPPLW